MKDVLSLIKKRWSIYLYLFVIITAGAYFVSWQIRSTFLALHYNNIRYHALELVAECELMDEKVKDGLITLEEAKKELMGSLQYKWYFYGSNEGYFIYIGDVDSQGNIRTVHHSLATVKRGVISANINTILSPAELVGGGKLKSRRGTAVQYFGDESGGLRGKGKRLGHATIFRPWNWLVVVSTSADDLSAWTRQKEFFVFTIALIVMLLFMLVGVLIDLRWVRLERHYRNQLGVYEFSFENSANYLAIFNEDGSIIKLSNSIISSSTDDDDLIGKAAWKSMWWGYSGSSVKKLKVALQNALERKESFESFGHPTSSGNTLHIHYRFNSMKWGDKNFIIGEGISSDSEQLVTDEYRFNEEVNEFFFENSAVPQFVVSTQRGVVAVNMAALVYFNFRNKSDILGTNFIDLSPEHQPGGDESAIAVNDIQSLAMANGTHVCEWTFVDSNKFEKISRVTLSRGLIRDEQVLFVTCNDISAEKRKDSENQYYNNQLEELVIDRTKKLKQKDEELRVAQEASSAIYHRVEINEHKAKCFEDILAKVAESRGILGNFLDAQGEENHPVPAQIESRLKDIHDLLVTSSEEDTEAVRQSVDIFQIIKDSFYLTYERLYDQDEQRELKVKFESDVAQARYPLGVRAIFHTVFEDSLLNLRAMATQGGGPKQISIQLQDAAPYLVIKITDNRSAPNENVIADYVAGINSKLLCRQRPVRVVVQEYGGDISVSYDQEQFEYEILLPIGGDELLG